MDGVEGLFQEEFRKLKDFLEVQFEEQRGLLRELSLQVSSNVDLDTQRLKPWMDEDNDDNDTAEQGEAGSFSVGPAESPLSDHGAMPTMDVIGKAEAEAVGVEGDEESDMEVKEATQKRATYSKKGSLQSLDSTDTFVSDFFHRSEVKAHAAASRLTQARFYSEQSHTGLVEMSFARSVARRVVTSPFFVYAVTFVIVFNLVILGIEVDVSTNLGQNDIPSWFTVCNGVVVALFTGELSLNLYAQGCLSFFCGRERWWNLFDLLIIVLSLLESALDLWVAASTSAGQSQPVSPSHLRFARSVRLARALRGIRVMRLLRYIGPLRILVLSIMSSMASLMWTLVLLLLLFYSFGVLFTQLVTDECRIQAILLTDDVNSIPKCTNEYAVYWESIPESMLTLFMAISGGMDWQDSMKPLKEISILAVLCLVMYMTITYFAIVNVITGVFVTTAMETTSADKDLAVMKQLQKYNAQVEDLGSLFTEISGGVHREVSIEQLRTAMAIPRFRAFLQELGIDAGEVGVLFKLLDADANGLVEREEFVKGCMNLIGTAKSLHLARMSYENKVTRRMIKEVRHKVSELSKRITLSSTKQDVLQV